MDIKRVFLIILDSMGIGELPDASLWQDEGSNTLGAIRAHANFHCPNLEKLGLFNIEGVGGGVAAPTASFARLAERSMGKDTTIGHWEIAGMVSPSPLPTYPNGFPEDVIGEFSRRVGRKVLCNRPYSGTDVIRDYGEEHVRTGALIVYTSADSVFQIAAHEDVVPLEELYRDCEIAREMLQGEHGVGRVIARPFTGTHPFTRTANRHDFSLRPPKTTMLDLLAKAGLATISVGKIEDIFDHRGLTASNHAAGNPACIEAWLDYMRKPFDGLCFTNLVDTDMQSGHRNDPEGFAGALAYFDQKLPEIQALMGEEDLLIVTADHGCDPTYPGTDHTREYIPLMVWHKRMTKLVDLGTRATYADIAATCAEWLGLPERFGATSFFDDLK